MTTEWDRTREQVISAARLPAPSSGEVDRIVGRYRLVVPAERCISLPDILNAAWHASTDADFWADVPQVRIDKTSNLRELVLKNIEVFELEQILGATL